MSVPSLQDGAWSLADNGKSIAGAYVGQGGFGGPWSYVWTPAAGTHHLVATFQPHCDVIALPCFAESVAEATYIVTPASSSSPPTPIPPTPIPAPIPPSPVPTPPVAAGTGLAALQAFLEWLLAQLLESAPFWPTAGLPHIDPFGP